MLCKDRYIEKQLKNNDLQNYDIYILLRITHDIAFYIFITKNLSVIQIIFILNMLI